MTSNFKMGIILSLSALALVLPTSSYADNWAGGGLGLNFSTFTNMTDPVGGNTEFQIGGFVDWGLSSLFYLRTGLRYNSYGVGVTNNSGNLSLDVSYLEIPILLKPTLDMGVIKPYLIAGPMLGIKVGSSATATDEYLVIDGTSDNYKTIDFSLDFGGGVEVPIISGLQAFLQLDYALGLINVFDNASADTRGTNLTAGAAFAF